MTAEYEEHAQEVVQHLQAAALELIAAARAMLDIAEDVVKDPGQAVAMASVVAHAAGQAQQHARSHGPPGAPDGHRVQHIRVS